MTISYKILILGASYGSLLGSRLGLAGHSMRFVCLPEEAGLINQEGARVLLPVKGVEHLVELNTQAMPGEVSADGSAAIRNSYADASVWDKFDPALMTLCSPDPQAFRPP